MKHIIVIRHLIAALMLSWLCCPLAGQIKVGSSLEMDKDVHNFGDIMLNSGPVSCTFTVKNTGDKPAVIYNVVSTCGCTDVKWTREPIRPGKTGTISATYSNDEGAYPFDKTLTVYFSDVRKPVTLKLRGVCIAEKKPLSELYPLTFGPLGMRETVIKCGNLEQGRQKRDVIKVANVSDSPIKVRFEDVTPGLEVSISPNPIPAGSVAELSYVVSSDRNLWGRNVYHATPVVDGRKYSGEDGIRTMEFSAFTRENFDNLDDRQKDEGPRPHFKESTWSFGKIRKGETVHAEFTFSNVGKDTFKIYKVDADACCWSHSFIPYAEPGESVTFRVHLDTRNVPVGEHLTIVTLTTNSPLRPVVNLFLAGWIE